MKISKRGLGTTPNRSYGKKTLRVHRNAYRSDCFHICKQVLFTTAESSALRPQNGSQCFTPWILGNTLYEKTDSRVELFSNQFMRHWWILSRYRGLSQAAVIQGPHLYVCFCIIVGAFYEAREGIEDCSCSDPDRRFLLEEKLAFHNMFRTWGLTNYLSDRFDQAKWQEKHHTENSSANWMMYIQKSLWQTWWTCYPSSQKYRMGTQDPPPKRRETTNSTFPYILPWFSSTMHHDPSRVESGRRSPSNFDGT